jgi:hypothetical protein
MRIHVAYIHPRQPHVVVRAGDANYAVVQCEGTTDIVEGDIIAGDPLLADVKWMFNISRSRLVNVAVRGYYPTLLLAVAAADSRQPALTIVGQFASRREPAHRAHVACAIPKTDSRAAAVDSLRQVNPLRSATRPMVRTTTVEPLPAA